MYSYNHKINETDIKSIITYLETKVKSNHDIVRSTIRKYLDVQSDKPTNLLTYDKVMNNINLIIKTLTKFGFSEEESVNYIVQNRFLIIESNDELITKFAILNNYGILEEVLINKPSILSRLGGTQLNARRMYSFIEYLISKRVKIKINVFVARKYSEESYEWLCHHFIFDRETKEKLLKDFENFISDNKFLELKKES